MRKTHALLFIPGAFIAATTHAQDFSLTEWNYDDVYENGWRAQQLLDAEVFGAGGEEVGSVENLLIDDEGQIVAIIAQVGGFWDIGDTHVAIPWKDAEFNDFNVQIPITEDNIEDYSLFKDDYFSRVDIGDLDTVDDDVQTGPGIWKATALINDYAMLEDGSGYGYVNELIFDNNGKLQSVVVSTTDSTTSRYFGYPWYGYGYTGYAWDPGLDYYTLPFTDEEIGVFDTPFDYDALEGEPL